MLSFTIYLDLEPIGLLSHDSGNNLFAFEYHQEWTHQEGAYPICPLIPLLAPEHESREKHSAIVRQFFENLLPEGSALDQVSIFHQISKSNLMGLMLVLGAETSGALRIGTDPIQVPASELQLRLITPAELENRIVQRQEIPFTVWDGKVRLSIAGFQDKIAIYKKNDQWYLVDGPELASTWIVKPTPERKTLKSLPENEFICMSLAKLIDIPVATVELVRIPSPVLLVKRFDRKELTTRVKRLHIIDACQALGRSSSMKYERPYGHSRDVKDIRDGVNYCDLFDLMKNAIQPIKDRLQLLRWAIYQIYIGNSDAHGKNISFFMNEKGISMAPAYDLVCIPALGDSTLSHTFSMAIGDAFRVEDITIEDIREFAIQSGLAQKVVFQEFSKMGKKLLEKFSGLEELANHEQIDLKIVHSIQIEIQKNIYIITKLLEINHRLNIYLVN